ncbi:EcsC family protein [Streptomyces sp. TBY4]|uniref:EcsC family protein n=1 Tax=Streptomyces sp. TBY4 TaxID=2962030 RepID=UPI0020B7EE77|nr:EcsC family protein [Streptomyces sp. TBY4]MCP3759082.1 EcsC family protein [Streptomyces sp. TBY4]
MTGSTPFRRLRFRKTGDPAVTLEGTTGPETGPGAPGVPAVLPDTAEAVPSASEAGEGSRNHHSGVRRLQAVKNGVRKGGESARAAALYLTDRVIENAPRVPVRDLATLRAQFPGLGPDQLADKLISGAANATSTVGAGIGAAAMLPVPPAMPAELAAEITGVAAIELKLIAELHEVYGLRPAGGIKDRSVAYLTSWTEERGVDLTKPTTLNAALGGQMKRELRQQIMKRMFRNLPNLMPFMVGAAVGAVMNRRDTRKLAEKVRADLRARAVPWNALPELPPLEQPSQPLPGAARAAIECAGPEPKG